MKRFTETEKWRDPWFRKLKPLTKLAFNYICDNCDAAGVWDADYDLADFQIGVAIAWPTVLEELGTRIRSMDNGKLHVTKFVEFQYGELVPECRPHQKIITMLKGYGIPLTKGIHRVHNPTSKERIGKEGGGAGEPGVQGSTPTAEEIYTAYPRKDDRQEALKAIRRVLAERPTLAPNLLEKVQSYALAVRRWPKDDRRFIPMAATWFNKRRFEDDPSSWHRDGSGVFMAINGHSPRDVYTEPKNWRAVAARKWPGVELPEGATWETLSVTTRNDIVREKDCQW